MSDFTVRTRRALGDDLMEVIREKKICVVGCGAVGSIFSEMLIRTGAVKISLIDADKVELHNLNRTFSFVSGDVGKSKAEVLADRLRKISVDTEDTSIAVIPSMLCERVPDDPSVEEARNCVSNSDVVIIASDTNRSRICCERLCREHSEDHPKDYMSVGIRIDSVARRFHYECAWRPQTNLNAKDEEGYGVDNASFASIVLEASAVGFGMLLHHLQNPNSREYRYCSKEYKDFVPIECHVVGEINNPKK